MYEILYVMLECKLPSWFFSSCSCNDTRYWCLNSVNATAVFIRSIIVEATRINTLVIIGWGQDFLWLSLVNSIIVIQKGAVPFNVESLSSSCNTMNWKICVIEILRLANICWTIELIPQAKRWPLQVHKKNLETSLSRILSKTTYEIT